MCWLWRTDFTFDFCVASHACRKACYDARVHRAPMKGIVGNPQEGAFSIVVNDGYEDDIDEGDVM